MPVLPLDAAWAGEWSKEGWLFFLESFKGIVSNHFGICDCLVSFGQFFVIFANLLSNQLSRPI